VARELLAASLVGVVSQRLIPDRAGKHVLNPEVLASRSCSATAPPRTRCRRRWSRAPTTACARSTRI
jgi:hypothetical protein